MNIAIGDGVENVWQLQDLSDPKSNQRIATSSGRMRMKIKPKTDKNAKICQNMPKKAYFFCSGPSPCCQGAPGAQGQQNHEHMEQWGVAWEPQKVCGKRQEVRIMTREGTESADGEDGEEDEEDEEDEDGDEDYDDYDSGNDVYKKRSQNISHHWQKTKTK